MILYFYSKMADNDVMGETDACIKNLLKLTITEILQF